MIMDRNIDQFIDRLADGLSPVKPLAHPLVRAIPYFVFAAIFMGLCVYFIGLREDIDEKLASPSFLLETAFMIFIAASAAIASAYLSVPDARGSKWIITLPFGALGVFSAWMLYQGFTGGFYMPQLHIDHCMGEGGFMAIVPLTMVVFMIRKGATTQPYLMATMNILFAGSLGYAALRYTCIMDTLGHSIVSHLMPYLLIGAILGLVARRLYKW